MRAPRTTVVTTVATASLLVGLLSTPALASPDIAFTTRAELLLDDFATDVAVRSDGRILVTGNFTNKVTLLNTDGSPNTVYPTGLGTGFNAVAHTVINRPPGGLSFIGTAIPDAVVGGDFTRFNNVDIADRLARLNTNGSLDTSFNTRLGLGFNGSVFALAPYTAGSTIVGGAFTTADGSPAGHIARVSDTGLVDPDFRNAIGTGFNGDVNALLALPDGRILAGGAFTTFNGQPAPHLALLSNFGVLDTSFETALGSGFAGDVNALARQTDGAIVVGGIFGPGGGVTGTRLARVSATGVPDNPFGTKVNTIDTFGGLSGAVTTVEVLDNGQIVVGGAFSASTRGAANRIARFNADGSPDNLFAATVGRGFDARVNALAVQPDGNIVVGGGFTALNQSVAGRIARLTGVPGTVTVSSATPSNRSIALQFTAPAHDGGSPITDYVIAPASGQGTCTLTAVILTTVRASCTGLTNGTPTRITIRAASAEGEGAPVTTSAVTPRTVPGAPRSLAVTFPAARTARVTWAPPTSNGGSAITRFETCRAQCGVATNWKSAGLRNGVPKRSATFSSIRKGTRVSIKVRAVNAAGVGPIATLTFTQRT